MEKNNLVKNVTIDELAVMIKNGFEAVDKRFEGVDRQFESIDKRFESIDKRFENIDKRFEDLRIELKADIKKVDVKVDKIYKALPILNTISDEE